MKQKTLKDWAVITDKLESIIHDQKAEIETLRAENQALIKLLKKIQVEGGLGVARHREIDRAINRQETKG